MGADRIRTRYHQVLSPTLFHCANPLSTPKRKGDDKHTSVTQETHKILTKHEQNAIKNNLFFKENDRNVLRESFCVAHGLVESLFIFTSSHLYYGYHVLLVFFHGKNDLHGQAPLSINSPANISDGQTFSS